MFVKEREKEREGGREGERKRAIMQIDVTAQ